MSVAGAKEVSPQQLVEPPDDAEFGVAVTGEERVLATHTSALLVEDVVVTNKVSQNLHAELLLRHLGIGAWQRWNDCAGGACGAVVPDDECRDR